MSAFHPRRRSEGQFCWRDVRKTQTVGDASKSNLSRPAASACGSRRHATNAVGGLRALLEKVGAAIRTVIFRWRLRAAKVAPTGRAT